MMGDNVYQVSSELARNKLNSNHPKANTACASNQTGKKISVTMGASPTAGLSSSAAHVCVPA